MKLAYIYSAKRTAIGSFMGSLASVAAPRLGAVAARSALEFAGIALSASPIFGASREGSTHAGAAQSGSSGPTVDEAIVGCVLPAGLGQAPARQVALFSGLSQGVRALTLNKVCGSGLKAVVVAADRIALGRANLVLAGGIENMSQSPFYVKALRSGARMGNQEMQDGMILDGLWDVYNQFHMGKAGELCAREYKFSRESQDLFAQQSYSKALNSITSGVFASEVAPVVMESKKDKITFVVDEEPGRGKLDQFAKLRPAFDESGTITAANASSLNDGAAMLVVGAEKALPSKPLARILHSVEFAQAPEWFTTAPVGAMKALLSDLSLTTNQIDLFEINEAFAVVTMAAQKELEIPDSKVNIRGGAVALGHPIGASGARILTTLIHALQPKQRGIATLCIGGGEAIAVAIERL